MWKSIGFLRRVAFPSLFILVAFLATFAIIRVITFMIRIGVGPFHNVSTGGLHIHHMVWGILILLAVGYLLLVPIRSAATPTQRFVSCATALAYGIGAALTIDEFALWLYLKDVYWESQGLESIFAAVIFVALLAISIWGGPILAARAGLVVREMRTRTPFGLRREEAAS